MLRDLIFLILALMLIGSGSWLALAGMLLAVFPNGVVFADIGAPAALDRHPRWVIAAAVLIGLIFFLMGANLAARIVA